eukprot:11157417-Lingulodinium_polyedra.AAC.1
MHKRLKPNRQRAGLLRRAAVAEGRKHITEVAKAQAHAASKENAAAQEAIDRYGNDVVDLLAKEAA